MDAAPSRYPSPVAINLSASSSLFDSSNGDTSDMVVGTTRNAVTLTFCNVCILLSVVYALIELKGVGFIEATLFVGVTNP